jgi:hypothetical protein
MMRLRLFNTDRTEHVAYVQDSAHLHKTRGQVKKWMEAAEAAEAVETVGSQAYEDVLATVIINKVSLISKAV